MKIKDAIKNFEFTKSLSKEEKMSLQTLLEIFEDDVIKEITDYLLRKQEFCQKASKEVSGIPTVVTVSAELWSRANTLMEARDTILRRQHTKALKKKKL